MRKIMWLKVQTLLAALLFCSSLLAADENLAVVRIPSHGCSATVIATAPGKTWILGCGHAYTGSDRTKPMVFDIMQRQAAAPKHPGSRLLTVDYNADLSLVLLYDGPVDYVCHVAPVGYTVESTHRILSCGFDEMKFPAHNDLATIVSDENGIWYTREKPWHGRSGGGLIDMTEGVLIGVCQGYESPYSSPRTRGMYIDLRTIQKFIKNYNESATWTPQRKQYSQPQPRPCPT